MTLAPCAERTGGAKSCAQLLCDGGVARLVIATRDPHPQGASLAALQAAGITIEIGLLEAKARAINAGFFGAVGIGILWNTRGLGSTYPSGFTDSSVSKCNILNDTFSSLSRTFTAA